jgi:SAM-dependent methyltransferase
MIMARTIEKASKEAQEVSDQYSKISKHYEYWFKSSWPEPAKIQGKALESVLRGQGLQGRLRALDLTSGMGTQAIGLAMCGHEVVALDISAGQVERGQKEAEAIDKALPIEFALGDATHPADYVSGTFDAIFSFGNSLPLLGSADALRSALSDSLKLLNPGGVFLASLRDHTDLRKRQPHLIGSGPVNIDGKKGVWVETGIWMPDGKHYTSHITFVLNEPRHEEYYYPFPPLAAVTKEEFVDLMKDAGFANVSFHEKDEHPEFTCPLFLGKRPE